MRELLVYSLHNVLSYLTYAGSLALLLAVSLAIFLWITPFKEIRLIREGNNAAAISFAGVLVGFALPLHAVASSAGTFYDMLIWAVTVLLGQLLGLLVAWRIVGNLRSGIEADRVSYGILLGGIAIAIGLINSASLGGY
ncbi:MAG: inner membrane protein YjfL [Pseudomonadota bacterium]|jgi:putative membrane protein